MQPRVATIRKSRPPKSGICEAAMHLEKQVFRVPFPTAR
jgi:hypothetical protein